MKRLFAVLLAMAMVMMTGSVFAADLTISNATLGQEYKAFRIFDAKPTDPNDLSQGVSYIATATQIAIEGFTDVFDASPDQNGHYTIKKKDDVLDSAVIAFIKDNIDQLKLEEAPAGTYSDNSTYVFTDLPDGYYYVTSTLGTMVSIDTAGNTISIVDKNASAPEGPVKKITAEESSVNTNQDQNGISVENNEASVGSVESFKVEFKATNWVQEADNDSHVGTGHADAKTQITEYNFTDTPIGLDIDPDTVKVMVDDADVTLTIQDIAVIDGVLSFTIPWVDENGKSLYAATVKEEGNGLIPVVITYDAKVTEVAATRTAPNEVEVKYNNEHSLGKASTTTYTYKCKLQKVDEFNAPLLGAIFELYYGDEIDDNAQPLTFTKIDSTTYLFDPDGTVTQITPAGDNAEALIIGLDNASYTIRETVTPSGYNKIDDTAVTGLTKETNETDGESSVNVSSDIIVNNKGTELPSTGGIGTTAFYVIGGLLVIGAAIVLIARRKAQE